VLRDEFLSAEACHALDPLHVVIDVSARGIVGYDAADWLREHQRFAMGMSDHHRIEATVSVADDHQSAARLVTALSALTCSAAALPRPSRSRRPGGRTRARTRHAAPRCLLRRQADRPCQRGGRVHLRRADHPYLPGIPVMIPGERFTGELLEYLRTGLAAGMQLPDPADPSLDTIRVVSEAASPS
jgi:arginine decarboxylase